MKLRLRTAAALAVAAAAFAAGSPAALAATPAHNRPGLAAMTRPAATTSDVCTARNKTWLHVYFAQYPGLSASLCYGGAGDNYPPATEWLKGFCGGNNYGYLAGKNEKGQPERQDFGPGTTVFYFRGSRFPGNEFGVTHVHITKWSGSDTCP